MRRLMVLGLAVAMVVGGLTLPASADRYEKLTVLASAARTATGTSSSVDLVKAIFGTDNRHKGFLVAVYLDITAKAGTSPTLDVKIQCSNNDTDFFDPASTAANRDSYTFAQKTDTGKDVKLLSDVYCRYLRESHTIGGTSPSFTYSVIIEVLGGDKKDVP